MAAAVKLINTPRRLTSSLTVVISFIFSLCMAGPAVPLKVQNSSTLLAQIVDSRSPQCFYPPMGIVVHDGDTSQLQSVGKSLCNITEETTDKFQLEGCQWILNATKRICKDPNLSGGTGFILKDVHAFKANVCKSFEVLVAANAPEKSSIIKTISGSACDYLCTGDELKKLLCSLLMLSYRHVISKQNIPDKHDQKATHEANVANSTKKLDNDQTVAGQSPGSPVKSADEHDKSVVSKVTPELKPKPTELLGADHKADVNVPSPSINKTSSAEVVAQLDNHLNGAGKAQNENMSKSEQKTGQKPELQKSQSTEQAHADNTKPNISLNSTTIDQSLSHQSLDKTKDTISDEKQINSGKNEIGKKTPGDQSGNGGSKASEQVTIVPAKENTPKDNLHVDDKSHDTDSKTDAKLPKIPAKPQSTKDEKSTQSPTTEKSPLETDVNKDDQVFPAPDKAEDSQMDDKLDMKGDDDDGDGMPAADDDSGENEMPANDGKAENNLLPPPDQEKLPQDKATDNLYNSKKFEYTDSHFFTYFLTVVILCIIVYLVVHNKQKIIALIVEGRHQHRKRPNTTNYKKLDSSLEEAMQSSVKATSSSHVIF